MFNLEFEMDWMERIIKVFLTEFEIREENENYLENRLGRKQLSGGQQPMKRA